MRISLKGYHWNTSMLTYYDHAVNVNYMKTRVTLISRVSLRVNQLPPLWE